MITLVYPKEGENRYLFWQNACFGPFDQNYARQGEAINFDSTLTSMKETRGIFYENNVDHQKVSGKLVYYPLTPDCLPDPVSYSPYQVKIPVVGSPYFVTSRCGFAIDRCSSMIKASLQGGSTQYAWEYDFTLNRWTMFRVSTSGTSPFAVNAISKYTILGLRRVSTSMVYVDFTQVTYVPGTASPALRNLNWSVLQSYETIRDLCYSAQVSGTYTSASSGSFYQGNPSKMLSPSDSKDRIDMLIRAILPTKLPLEEKHYGDLAMSASENVNAIKMNMIAFIKDLRTIPDLIPKLSNLRSLKGIASTYLSGQYGILPTISDLREIMEACRGMKPYLDRSGFTSYTAGHTSKTDSNGLHYELVQRIKLAVEDEDSEFQKLVQRLDNIGLLPTTEKLWDLVNYSFVVDWFIDVGGLLERVDTHLRLLHLNVKYATMSHKTSVTGNVVVPTKETPFVGSIDWVHYRRWVSDQCPVPPLSLQINTKPFTHWAEATALIVQRL